MALYSPPPPARAFRDDKPTLLVCWWCTSFAATIVVFRVCGRYVRSEKLFKEDWLAVATLIPMLIRMAFVHVVLLYGTNNVMTGGLTDDEIWHRSIGSRAVLAARAFYAATLWMNKYTISEYFKRLTPLHLWRRSYERVFRAIRWTFLVSFITVLIADIAECQPITAYWQVVPDPGPSCRQGYVQLITLGSANVITDLLLVAFPIPIIVLTQMRLKRKFKLGLLFALSLAPVATTLVRIPKIIDYKGQQQYRSLWASIEILFATAAANALVLGSFVRDRGVKKLKYKLGSVADSVEPTYPRRGTAVRLWGSDEDLVRDLGLGLDPELRGPDDTIITPRLAPIALPKNIPLKGNPDWDFPSPTVEYYNGTSDYGRGFSPLDQAQSRGGATSNSFNSSRRVSFFDVGGLLDSEDSSKVRGSSSITAEEGRSDNSRSRKAGGALLEDLGGFLKPPRSFRRANNSGGQNMELQDMAQAHIRSNNQTQRPGSVVSLKDVGGLLR